jgi:hypothetical protein
MWTLWRPLPNERERWGAGWNSGVATLPSPRVSGDGDLILVDRAYAPDDGRERDYRVRIVTAGNLSTARFVFSDDGGATESHPSSLIPPPIPLTHGITAAFTGTVFNIDDRWTFRGLLPFGPGKTGDLSRATRAKSATDSPVLHIVYPSVVAPSPEALFLSDWRAVASVRVTAGASDTGFVSLPNADGARFAISLAPFNLPAAPDFAVHFQPAHPTQPVEIAECHLLERVSDLQMLTPPSEADLAGATGERLAAPALPLAWVWRFAFSGIRDADLSARLNDAEQWAAESASEAAFVVARAFSSENTATDAAYIGRFLPPEKARSADHRAHTFSGAFSLRFFELEGLFK